MDPRNKLLTSLMPLCFATSATFGLRTWALPLTKSWIRTCFSIRFSIWMITKGFRGHPNSMDGGESPFITIHLRVCMVTDADAETDADRKRFRIHVPYCIYDVKDMDLEHVPSLGQRLALFYWVHWSQGHDFGSNRVHGFHTGSAGVRKQKL